MTNLNTPFMIGNVEIPNRTVLAPNGWCHQLSFRTIAKELGLDSLSWKWSLTRESNTTMKNPSYASYR